jgi:DNA-binding winged helix-turn-helix (wHTH) protein/Tol biopolymer transport system component
MVPTASSGAAADPSPAGRSSAARHLVFGAFSFDAQSRLLRRGALELPLPPRVLGVLEVLLERAGDIVPRQELIDRVWKDAFVTDTSLAEAISVLRQTLGDDPQNPAYVQTVHRRGYRFVAAVTPVPGARDRVEPLFSQEAPSDRVSPSIAGQLIPWSIAAICGAIAVAAVWQLMTSRRTAEAPAARFAISAEAGTTFDDRAPALALSPTAVQVAWSACDATACRLYSRALNALTARAIAGTEGAHAPFFSPDGEWIGFFADGRLKKVAVAGGAPVVLADAPQPLGGAWRGREIIFAASSSAGLMRVDDRGGSPQVLTVPDQARGEVRHTWPSVMTDDRTLLFTIETTRDGEASGNVGALRLDSSRPSWRTVIAGGGIARAAAGDLVVFTRGTDLQAALFDPLRQAVTGEPRTIVTNVATADGLAHFALSASGDLLFAQDDPQRENLSWLPLREPQGQPGSRREIAADTRRLRNPSLSPDGLRIAAIGSGEGRADVWVADVERGAAARLTHDRLNVSPIWSPDGRTVYFASQNDGPFEIWRREADGANPSSRVLARDSHVFPGSIAPDGSQLAVIASTATNGTDILLLPLHGGDPRALVESPFDDDAPVFSPGGTMVAYQSADTGRWQVYVQRISDGRRVLVSTAGGDHPVWFHDGGSLVYRTEGGLVRATVSETAEGPKVGEIVRLGTRAGVWIAGVAPDSRILIDPRGSTRPTRAAIALGWAREARQLLGPPAAQTLR